MTIRILYVGNYLDGTGWSQAAIDYILALDSVGLEVVPRAIKLNNHQGEVPERLLQLQARSARGCDVVIQHVLPHMTSYNGKLRNICLFASETSNFATTVWAERLALMDDVWLINSQQYDACKRSGLEARFALVPHACDTERFARSYPPLERLKPLLDRGEFLFYFIGEYSRRKNLNALLKAFHLEFGPDENTRLVIKTNRSGMSPEECGNHVRGDILKCKRALKLHGGRIEEYKEDVVITDRLSQEGMMRLHSACHCFVMPSFGEAWSLPSFAAMAMGKTPIVSDCTGFKDYLSEKEGFLVRGRWEPCVGAEDTLQDLYTGHENWFSVDVNHLRSRMREAYQLHQQGNRERALNGIRRAYDFSYEEVGRTMASALGVDVG